MSMSSPLPLGCNHHFHTRSFATLQQRLAHTKYLLIGEVTSNDVAITHISRETHNHTDSEECVRSLHTTDEESKIETESETSMMHVEEVSDAACCCLHDAKPAVMSTPVNDQVLIYTPESREAIVCKFLLRILCHSSSSL